MSAVAGLKPRPQGGERGVILSPGWTGGGSRRGTRRSLATPRCWRSSAGTRTSPGGSGRRVATCWPRSPRWSYRGSRGRDAALLIGRGRRPGGPADLAGHRAPATADVQVVARAATLLLRHGSPYLGPGQLSAWRSYDPYLPADDRGFGLFRAAGLPGVIGDPRLWIAVTCVALLTVAFGLAAPHQVRRYAGRRSPGAAPCRVRRDHTGAWRCRWPWESPTRRCWRCSAWPWRAWVRGRPRGVPLRGPPGSAGW